MLNTCDHRDQDGVFVFDGMFVMGRCPMCLLIEEFKDQVNEMNDKIKDLELENTSLRQGGI